MDRRERSKDPETAFRTAFRGLQTGMWTALPGLVQSFDPVAETCVVQPAIQALIRVPNSQTPVWVTMPLLTDCPVLFPSGGGFTLTFPIAHGDEGLVLFASRCIDNWWLAGGVQTQPELRMHDLSDGFVLVGPRSQPRKLSPQVNAANVQLRSDDGQAYVEITPGHVINLHTSTDINLSAGGKITLTAGSEIDMTAPVIKEN
jgi:Phage protein Gp138 N-terminal domain